MKHLVNALVIYWITYAALTLCLMLNSGYQYAFLVVQGATIGIILSAVLAVAGIVIKKKG